MLCGFPFLNRFNLLAPQLLVEFMDSLDEPWRHIGLRLVIGVWFGISQL